MARDPEVVELAGRFRSKQTLEVAALFLEVFLRRKLAKRTHCAEPHGVRRYLVRRGEAVKECGTQLLSGGAGERRRG